jgi:hypothetical protein
MAAYLVCTICILQWGQPQDKLGAVRTLDSSSVLSLLHSLVMGEACHSTANSIESLFSPIS